MMKNEKRIDIAMMLINIVIIFMCLTCLKTIDNKTICMITSLIMTYTSFDSMKILNRI
ncbi:MAG: hypothetical protein J6D47_21790 [Peptostreptococcaceae bacterium]|nr:hypothetical protein [Peptostreptococcaceae bacterium]